MTLTKYEKETIRATIIDMCCYRIAHLLNILNSSCEIGIRDIAVSTVPFSILKDVKDKALGTARAFEGVHRI